MHDRYPGNSVGTIMQLPFSLSFGWGIREAKHHVLLCMCRFPSVIKAACAFKLCVYLKDITLQTV